MNTRNQEIQDKILLHALEDVAFEGWQWSVIEGAAVNAGYDEDMAIAVFPEKLSDVLAYFSNWADRQMLSALENQKPEDMPVRLRIKTAVLTRLKILEPHKEAVRAASIYWLIPPREIQATKLVWKTADAMWHWAGDTAQDYNHYTKRGLLSGVITATTLAWLNDTSEDHQETDAFLDRRIANVLSVGKVAGKILGPIMSGLGALKSKCKKA